MRWERIDWIVAAAPGRATHTEGALIRGAFGARLRAASCAPPGKPCAGCTDAAPCTYRAVFDQGVEPPAYRVIGGGPSRSAEPGVSLVLLGNPDPGHRARCVNAFEEALATLGWTVVERNERGYRQLSPALLGRFKTRLYLDAPLRIKRYRKVLREPAVLDFPLFMDFLLLRLDRLDRIYGSGHGLPGLERLRSEARRIGETRGEVVFQRSHRFSHRQERAIPMGGWTGWLEWSEVPGIFLPFLKAGEDLGVGSGCSHGLGAYTLDATPTGMTAEAAYEHADG